MADDTSYRDLRFTRIPVPAAGMRHEGSGPVKIITSRAAIAVIQAQCHYQPPARPAGKIRPIYRQRCDGYVWAVRPVV